MEAGKSRIPGANVLLMGGAGTGKTHSIRTLIEAGITPFCIFTEPGMETLSDLPGHPYHYHYIPPVASNWSALSDIAKKVNSLGYDSLVKMTDTNRGKYNQFIEVIETCNNFVCDECGEAFGDVNTWNTSRALVLDSLTGFNKMAMQLVVGGKVAKTQSDWGIAQDMIRKLLDNWTTASRCWFVLIAHQAKERDEVTGGMKVMINTLGRALAPEVPNFFSDVIEAIRIGEKFTWDTAGANVDTKARNVPISSNLPPSFVPLVARWKEKGGVIEAS